MLANYFFSDFFTEVDPGILPQSLAAGTASGSAIPIGGSAGFQKLLFNALFAAGTATTSVIMYLATATASGASFTSLSQTIVQIVTTLSLSCQYDLKIDTRDVAFANLSITAACPTFVKVIVAVTGATIPIAMKCLGWEARQDPNLVLNARTVPVVTQTIFY